MVIVSKIKKVKQIELPSGQHLEDDDHRPGIHIIANTSTYNSDEEYPDDGWGRPNTETHYNGLCVSLPDNSSSYWDIFPLRYAVKSGDQAFVVVVSYITGDTFGSDSGNIALVGVECTKEDAELLESAAKGASSTGAFEFSFHDWKYWSGNWTGYFDRVEDIFIERITIP